MRARRGSGEEVGRVVDLALNDAADDAVGAVDIEDVLDLVEDDDAADSVLRRKLARELEQAE